MNAPSGVNECLGIKRTQSSQAVGYEKYPSIGGRVETRRRSVTRFVAAALLAVASLWGSATAAEPCSDYDRAVLQLAEEARSFQTKRQFREYGFRPGGPYAEWNEQMRRLGDDNDQAFRFMMKFGFAPMEIHALATKYRSTGKLDSFYANAERNIRAARCQ